MLQRLRVKRVRMAAGLVAAAVITALPLAASAAPSGGGARSANTAPQAHTRVLAGGTAYWAEGAGAYPNWILPYTSLSYFSATNIQDFQQLMFRPLYWIGDGNQPLLNRTLSLADAPVFSDGGKTVTVSLKGFKWSNGQPVDAQDVVFFMNMLRSEKNENAGYAPGEFPDNVTSVKAPSPTSNSVTFTTTEAYNQQWFTLNELSQITPMPLAWDIDHLVNGKPATPTSGGCSSMSWNAGTIRDCHAVWTFLTDNGGRDSSPTEGADLSTYASNPLWQIVDGPWRLSAFSTDGEVTMVPNTAYSGAAPHIAKFVELPFTSTAAEFVAMVTGGTYAPTVGYLPLENAPAAPAEGKVGSNSTQLAGRYVLGIASNWETNYFPLNFNSTGDGGAAGHIFRQLYFRQAFQLLVHQSSLIGADLKNYAVDDDGPVPSAPSTEFLSKGESDNPYDYNQARARALLTSHGWSITAGQAAVCTSEAKCGSGIPTGTKLSFSMEYTVGYATPQMMSQEQASWASEGIDVILRQNSFDGVLEYAVKCSSGQSDCSWEMANWGGGWEYTPDTVPTGEDIFASSAPSNSGSYSNAENDSLIAASLTSPNLNGLQTWETYAAQQLPVVWQPDAVGLTETARNIGGVVNNPLDTLNPENWYFTSS